MQTSKSRIENHPSSEPRRKASRVVLMGAAAVIVVGGMFGAAQVLPPVAAIAQTAPSKAPAGVTQPAPLQAPAGVTMPSFADVIERVRGAVVSVKVTVGEVSAPQDESAARPGMPQFQPGDPMEEFFRRFGQGGPSMGQPRAQVRRSQGSGFVISADGYAVTNNHVVRNASRVQLTFDDGKTVDARVIGTDEKSDLALLKITDAGTYPFVSLAEKLPRVGDWVIAVGNPFGLGGTVTAGIVSARGRDIGSGPYDDFLQIDAPVNRGNSGGPTFDAYGKVVGVNTAIYSPSGGSVGIGFAIPANVVRNVVSSLKEKGSVSRGYIGVQIQPVTPDIAESLGVKGQTGALIAEATSGLPAERAGLRAGDIIVSVNGDKVGSPRDLARKIASINPGSKVSIGYLRQGRENTATLMLAEQPGQRRASIGHSGPSGPVPSSLRFGMTLAPAADVAGAGGEGLVVAQLGSERPGCAAGFAVRGYHPRSGRQVCRRSRAV